MANLACTNINWLAIPKRIQLDNFGSANRRPPSFLFTEIDELAILNLTPKEETLPKTLLAILRHIQATSPAITPRQLLSTSPRSLLVCGVS